MGLIPGTRVGPYEIVSSIGAGGMGEVFRAKDTKLNRDVAIKVLPEFAGGDADRLARFKREAQLLAALNHPNIAQIYGLEETSDGHALVMELVEGETLDVVISRRLAITDALALAGQVADALEAAHEKGIIHRDIKPGNVMVTHDGRVKVLDFGLAKDVGAGFSPPGKGPAEAGPYESATALSPAYTKIGMILGTAGYMSPEQAKGRAADKRSDVWAFGCLLYEMLTGRRAFEGEDVSDTLASVLRGEPDWTALPATVPPAIRTLIERCLVKDRTRRVSDISTVKFVLHEHATLTSASAVMAPATSMVSAVPSSSRSIPLFAALAAIAAAIAITVVVMLSLPSAPTASSSSSAVSRLSIVLPAGRELQDTDLTPLALSPDGKYLAYAAMFEGKLLLYQRALDESDSQALAGTEGAQSPFFSYDGKWIGFFANGQLKKVAVGGGALQVLCPASIPRGGSWSDDGQIYFAPANRTGIWRVADSGGTATEVTQLDRAQGEVSHRWPHVLPGNQGLLFTVWTGPGTDEKAVVLRTPSGEKHVLIRGAAEAKFVPPGHLVYARGESLMAVRFDATRPAAAANDVPVRLPGYIIGTSAEGAGFDVSRSGVLATLPGDKDRLARRIVWVDRDGRIIETLPVPVQSYEQVAISPDARHAVVQVADAVINLMLYDFERQSLTSFVKAGSSTQAPVWVDNQRVAYRGTRKGFRNLFIKSIDGSSDEERLTTKDQVNQTPNSVSADGAWLIFAENGSLTGADLWKVSLAAGHATEPVLITKANERAGALSPSGAWIAVEMEDSGHPEIWARPFPGPGGLIPISKDGGMEPVWSRDGKQLFFVNGDKFMAVDVTTSPKFTAGVPRQLYAGTFMRTTTGATTYSESKDGTRFLRVQPVQPEAPATRVDVVVNWLEELRRVVK